jgi:ABC-type transport system involved in multi-copper enzyme maturation permease subunit
MRHVATISWLTFHEAWRRRMVLLALILGLLFLVVYGIGFSLIIGTIDAEVSAMERRYGVNALMMAGFYVVHFLTVMLAIFASVDTIAGEIATHTIQAIVTKPVRRWHVVLGKWLGYAAMIGLYLGLLAGGIVAIVALVADYRPTNVLAGVALLWLEALVLLALSLLAGSRLSTLSNGVLLFMLYGLAFIGAWVEQIGTLFNSRAAVNVGIVTSLFMPVEALWRRAAYLMQPPVMAAIPSPFGGISPPSEAMVAYALCYAALALGLAMRVFGRRDL